jgi:hypothetical protein
MAIACVTFLLGRSTNFRLVAKIIKIEMYKYCNLTPCFV